LAPADGFAGDDGFFDADAEVVGQDFPWVVTESAASRTTTGSPLSEWAIMTADPTPITTAAARVDSPTDIATVGHWTLLRPSRPVSPVSSVPSV
jgi:hypothetical protein